MEGLLRLLNCEDCRGLDRLARNDKMLARAVECCSRWWRIHEGPTPYNPAPLVTLAIKTTKRCRGLLRSVRGLDIGTRLLRCTKYVQELLADGDQFLSASHKVSVRLFTHSHQCCRGPKIVATKMYVLVSIGGERWSDRRHVASPTPLISEYVSVQLQAGEVTVLGSREISRQKD